MTTASNKSATPRSMPKEAKLAGGETVVKIDNNENNPLKVFMNTYGHEGMIIKAKGVRGAEVMGQIVRMAWFRGPTGSSTALIMALGTNKIFTVNWRLGLQAVGETAIVPKGTELSGPGWSSLGHLSVKKGDTRPEALTDHDLHVLTTNEPEAILSVVVPTIDEIVAAAAKH